MSVRGGFLQRLSQLTYPQAVIQSGYSTRYAHFPENVTNYNTQYLVMSLKIIIQDIVFQGLT